MSTKAIREAEARIRADMDRLGASLRHLEAVYRAEVQRRLAAGHYLHDPIHTEGPAHPFSATWKEL